MSVDMWRGAGAESGTEEWRDLFAVWEDHSGLCGGCGRATVQVPIQGRDGAGLDLDLDGAAEVRADG